MFADRSTWDLTPTRLAEAIARKRAAGETLIDLTASNPTTVGFAAPGSESLRALADPRGLTYRPEAIGLPEARAAVAAYYADAGITVDPDHVIITASTSEAYGFLFKLLANPGDDILVPRPSYPLFDYLAGLEGLQVGHYRLDRTAAWRIDLASVAAAIGPRTRALLCVSPNNPTGSVTTRDELRTLDQLAARHSAAVVVDEVFADFPLPTTGIRPVVGAAASAAAALTFSLSGLSKVCGLPQFKLGWMVVGGPATLAAEAIERLAIIADTYLSVATPVQLAAAHLLADRHRFQSECQARTHHNLDHLKAAVAAEPSLELLDADAGWYAIVRVPRTLAEEDLAVDLVERHGIIIHTGHMFDFDAEAFIVLSLLTTEPDFARGLTTLIASLMSRQRDTRHQVETRTVSDVRQNPY